MNIDFRDRTWLTWLSKVRIIVITLLFGIELAVTVLVPSDLPKGLFVSAILLWYALAAFFTVLVPVWKETEFQARIQIVSDLCMATVVVYLTGGIESSFHFLYPLIIIAASTLLPRSWTFLTAALAFILNGGMLELSYFGVIPSYPPTHASLRSLQVAIFINLCAYMAIAYLASHLSNTLRQASAQLRHKSGALEDLQAIHGNIVDSINEGLVTTRLDGHVTLINAAGEKLLERSQEEVFGRAVQDLFVEPLPSLGEEALRCELRSRVPSGRYKTFALSRSVLEVPGRGAVGYVYTFDDLTEIRRLEREVRLRDRLTAVGRMAAAIAHEIRNPLSSIAGSVKMLSQVAVLDQEQRTLVNIVTRESERLNNIVTDFLSYSREKQYQFTLSDLVPLLQDTLTLLENRHAGESSGKSGEEPPGRLRVVRRFAGSQAHALVDGDRIKQVFWNICDNAARAMPDGGTLTVTLRSREGWWTISFADTGPGLSEKDKVFEPFQSTTGGTGLGLAIVYQIVQAHDGKIFARSAPGHGTEFVIELKHVLPPSPGEQEDPALAAAAHGASADAEKVFHG
ncbi:MAG: nitrogen regulation protein NR(II) [Candidatus Korobacteraceae bacterium]